VVKKEKDTKWLLTKEKNAYAKIGIRRNNLL
jgi:hypothetical protein